MKKILLFSSGMDSFIAWFYLGKPDCLFVNLGQRYAAFEQAQARRFADLLDMNLTVISVPEIGPTFEQADAHIPLRNMLLATLGAMHGNHVFVVCQEGERSIPDRTEEFFKASSRALTVGDGRDIVVDAVFWRMTKVQMVKWYLGQKLPVDLLQSTYSCFSGLDGNFEPCASCPACFRRAHAFLLNGLDEDWYPRLRKWDGLDEYRVRLDQGHYTGKRAREMDAALGLLGH